jgi:4-hydroxybenzoate polyprenyltransferase
VGSNVSGWGAAHPTPARLTGQGATRIIAAAMAKQRRLLSNASLRVEAPAEAAPLRLPTGSPTAYLRSLLISMRPRQWTKNLIVYMAFIFSVGGAWHARDPDTWLPLLGKATLAFALFCLVSSADYLVNDVRDRETDRLHPTKRRRPIAAGALSPRTAVGWAAVLSMVGLGGMFALDLRAGGVVAGYIALMLAYSFYLKHTVLLDIMTIAAGFVLRAMSGALVIEVPISPWLYVVTALGALFLAINKRRAELLLLEENANRHRATLEEYTPDLLNQLAATVTASTLIAYGLYTFTADNLPNNHSMMLTIPFVLYGIFRYLFLVHAKNQGGSPEDVLLKDWPLLLDILLWVVASLTVLVVFRE